MLSKITKFLGFSTSPNVFFSIQTGQQGFTDQMMQLSAFYKLGRACGFPFYYIPFESIRSRPLEKDSVILESETKHTNVYDFLGINTFFKSQHEISFDDSCVFEVNLSDAILELEGIRGFDGLVEYVQKIVNQRVSSTNGECPWLFVLRLDRAKPAPGKGKRQFFALINHASEAEKFILNFNELYNRERQISPIDSLFDSTKQKVLFHIRQGDTAVLKTPWDTFVPVDIRRPDYLGESASLEEVKGRYHDKFVDSIFTPSDYYLFWKDFATSCLKGSKSVHVFSDGYKRAVDEVVRNAPKMSLSNEQIQELKEQRDTVDNEAFSEFFEDIDISCHIGESALSLYQLIDSALNADIIITSAQQRMLPKLIANYSPKEGAAVIVLYRNEEPDYSDVMASHKKRFIYVNIDTPDFEYVSQRLIDFGLKL